VRRAPNKITLLPQTLTVPAFAKINLGLRVLGKRPDGYHELETIFQTISLHDTITFAVTENSEIVLSCDDPSLPAGAENLVYRAAEQMQKRFLPKAGVRIRLEKRIPAQAGLGGGASDAAVTLLALTYLWDLKYGLNGLLDLASSLGADVPFFLFGGTARGSGIGANIDQLPDLDEKFVLIIKPNADISTEVAYRSLSLRCLTSIEAKTILSSSQPDEILGSFHPEALQNDFETVVFELAPEIQRAKFALMNAGADATLLAGSGSAVFGTFRGKHAQARAIQAIELETGWRVFPCRTIARHEYRNALGELFRRLD
jgi:4-diphosphocytidyl-2-C-methyl-D-erythritol kinase